jgi:4-hydroxy-2-oxoheptanedioate aldolase
MTRLATKLQEHRPLLGVALCRYDPVFVEIAALLGFHVLWIEMEHAPISFGEAADLCRIASGVGLLTMIRIPDARRDSVLRAAECGPDILDLPMVNAARTVNRFVRHARYAPIGERGFYGGSRAVRYSVSGNIVAEQQRINTELCLMGQIETSQAVDNAEQICQAPDLDAVFFGPGDLSVSLGFAGQVTHPLVVDAITSCIGIARQNGKLTALLADPKDAAKWATKGVDLIFCGSDIVAVRNGLRGIADQFRTSLSEEKL